MGNGKYDGYEERRVFRVEVGVSDCCAYPNREERFMKYGYEYTV